MSERTIVKRLFEQLSKSQRILFPQPRGSIDAPDGKGVYIIYDPKGKVVHVGRTSSGKKGLRQRLGNHLHNASSFTSRHLRGNGDKLRKGYKFRYLVVPDKRIRTLLEAHAVRALCPAHLGLGESSLP